MTHTITVDGYEFECTAPAASLQENLNAHLEKAFRRADVRDYLSRRHPELYPAHLGLRADADLRLHAVRWTKGALDPWGEYDRSWACSPLPDPERYLPDILVYYATSSPALHTFILNHLAR